MASLQSNAGGVSARQGFKYQDHVAARFVIEMMDNPTIVRVECETSDDIFVVRNVTGLEEGEYIQVKTTEGDKKWSLTEIWTRENKRLGTSLVEKSLKCDSLSLKGRFRIVSRRDIYKNLECLTIALEERANLTEIDELGTKLAKKLKFTSPQGNDLKYWANNTIWEVYGDIRLLKDRNELEIFKFASRNGDTPVHRHIQSIYSDLLKMVDEAAAASKITDIKKKSISRKDILDWWESHIKTASSAALQTSKPYRVETDAFFVEIHSISEDDILRHLVGYDAGFDINQWRAEPLAEYLADWLPEMTLKASELVGIKPMELRRKLRSSIEKIEESGDLDGVTLLGEALLHAIIRHHYKSEPIACKLFYQAKGAIKGFRNAHIVHANPTDELWLGKAKITEEQGYVAAAKSIASEVSDIMDAEFLKAERNLIVALRESNHLEPTSLEKVFLRNASVNDLLKVLCVPVMIAYESSEISNGYSSDYMAKLAVEITRLYYDFKPRLGADLARLTVRVFFVPIASVTKLKEAFLSKIK